MLCRLRATRNPPISHRPLTAFRHPGTGSTHPTYRHQSTFRPPCVAKRDTFLPSNHPRSLTKTASPRQIAQHPRKPFRHPHVARQISRQPRAHLHAAGDSKSPTPPRPPAHTPRVTQPPSRLPTPASNQLILLIFQRLPPPPASSPPPQTHSRQAPSAALRGPITKPPFPTHSRSHGKFFSPGDLPVTHRITTLGTASTAFSTPASSPPNRRRISASIHRISHTIHSPPHSLSCMHPHHP